MRRFGAAGLRALEDLKPGADVRAVATAAGLSAAEAAHFHGYLHAQALFNADLVREQKLTAEQQAELDRLNQLNEDAREAFRAQRADVATRLTQQVLEGRRALLGPDHPLTAQALSNRALLYAMAGDLDQAEAAHRQALAARRKAFGDRHPETAHSRSGLAMVLRETGHYEEAEALYRQVLAVYRAVMGPRHPRTASAMNDTSLTLQLMGRLDGARATLEEAIPVIEATDGPSSARAAITLQNLGSLLGDIGDLVAAERTLRRALEIFRAVLPPAHPLLATAMNNLADMQLRRGHTVDALAGFEKALGIFEVSRGPAHPEVLAARSNVALTRLRLGRVDDAASLLEETVSRARTSPIATNPHFATLLGNLADVRMAQGRLDDAITLFEEALQIRIDRLGDWHPDTGHAHGNLALAVWRKGDVERARTHQRHIMAALRSFFATTIDAARSDLEILDVVRPLRSAVAITLTLFSRPGDTTTAFETALAWQGAATIGEQLWRDLRRAEADHPEAAPRLARYRELQRERLKLLLTTPLGSREQVAREEALATLRRDAEALAKRLAKLSPSFADRRELLGATPQAVCAALRRHERHLVDFVRYDRFDPTVDDDPTTRPDDRFTPSYLAFVVVPAGCEVTRVDLGTADALDAVIDTYRRAVRKAASCSGATCALAWERLAEAGRELRTTVWAPVAASLPAGAAVWIVPDGRLTEVPFGALVGDDDRYLLEERDVGYLPYPAAPLRRPIERTGEGALVVGDLDYQSSAAPPQWSRCTAKGCGDARPTEVAEARRRDGAAVCGYDATWMSLRTEAAPVAALLGRRLPHGAALAVGPHGSELAVRDALPGRRVLHLATHGFFAPADRCADTTTRDGHATDPLRLSAVVLSGANTRRDETPDHDGVLSAREVVGLDLRGTDLVVLSACETGLGEAVAGEGVLGLSRAFLVAGAGAVVVSLWQVPSDETSRLFERFYEVLLRTRRPSVTAALREAQRALLEEARAAGEPWSSALWGAFVPLVAAP